MSGEHLPPGDFPEFDYVIAMDGQNARTLKQLAPQDQAHKIRLFTDFGSTGAHAVPDPYGGGPEGFEQVLSLVEDAARGLLEHLRARDDM